MQFQLFDQAPSLGRLKPLIQSCRGMGVQVIHDHYDLLGSRIVDIYQVANEAGEVRFGTLRGHLQIALARPSVHWPQTDCRSPVARTQSRSIPAAPAAWVTAPGSRSPTACWFRPDRPVDAARHTVGCTPRGSPPVFHTNSALCFGGIHHCDFSQGLSSLCANTCRTVSREMLSTLCNYTSLSESLCKVQRSCPSSGWLHTSAINCASCSPSNLRRRGV